MQTNISIGIDLGGTTIKGVLLQKDGQLLHQLQRDTNDSSQSAVFTWKAEIAKIVEELTPSGSGDIPIGISAPGLTDPEHQWISYMPGRLEGLEQLHWAEFLKKKSVKVINDAKAAMLAEYHFGKAQNRNDVVLLTLGTGVGGAILIQRKLYEGWLSRAGHLGHLSLQPFSEGGILSLPGTLEMAIGNATITERSKGKFSSTAALVSAHQEGDPWATLVWLESIKSLAIGLSSIVNILSPELIILSGGITNAGRSLFHPLQQFMELYEWRPGGEITPITKAHFGAFAGAVGAACFALFE